MLSNCPICITRSIYLQPAYTLFSCSASLPCAATILGFLVFRSVVDRRLQTCLAFYNRFILNNLNGSTRGQRSSSIHFRSNDFRPRESEIINYGGNGARLNFTKIRLNSYDQFSPLLNADFNRQEEEIEIKRLNEIDKV